MPDILVVDDEVGIRELLSEILSDEGYGVLLAKDAVTARNMIKRKPDLVLLDIWMPDTDGVSLLKEWNANEHFDIPVIMMSGHATLDNAVEATKFGAVDFLEKPIAMKRLLGSVRTALEAKEPRIGDGSSHVSQITISRGPNGNIVRTRTVIADAALAQKPGLGDPEDEVSFAELDLNLPLRVVRDQFERIYFKRLLRRESYSMTRVAYRSGLERTHLYRKLKNLGLEIGKEHRNKLQDEGILKSERGVEESQED